MNFIEFFKQTFKSQNLPSQAMNTLGSSKDHKQFREGLEELIRKENRELDRLYEELGALEKKEIELIDEVEKLKKDNAKEGKQIPKTVKRRFSSRLKRIKGQENVIDKRLIRKEKNIDVYYGLIATITEMIEKLQVTANDVENIDAQSRDLKDLQDEVIFNFENTIGANEKEESESLNEYEDFLFGENENKEKEEKNSDKTLDFE